MSQQNLTPREERIYEFIKRSIEKNGSSPTLREICDELDYKTLSSVQVPLSNLRVKGFIRVPIGTGKKRAIELVAQKNISDVEQIPLEGLVAAGRLTEAVQYRDFIDVPRNILKAGAEYFALKVKGDSMIEEYIADGDLVVIRKQHEAINGQTVVAIVDNDATIKKFYRRKGHIELHPANPNYSIIKVDPDANFKILGVLSSVIRRIE